MGVDHNIRKGLPECTLEEAYQTESSGSKYYVPRQNKDKKLTFSVFICFYKRQFTTSMLFVVKEEENMPKESVRRNHIACRFLKSSFKFKSSRRTIRQGSKYGFSGTNTPDGNNTRMTQKGNSYSKNIRIRLENAQQKTTGIYHPNENVIKCKMKKRRRYGRRLNLIMS